MVGLFGVLNSDARLRYALFLKGFLQNTKLCTLVKKVWEADPLLCPQCHHEMRIVSLINDAQIIERILGATWEATWDRRNSILWPIYHLDAASQDRCATVPDRCSVVDIRVGSGQDRRGARSFPRASHGDGRERFDRLRQDHCQAQVARAQRYRAVE